MTLEQDTQTAIDAAPHLTAPQFIAARSALLALARKIDQWDAIVRAAQEWSDERGGRPAVPAHDNTSMPGYFRALAELGLTPSTWAKVSGAMPAAAPTSTTTGTEAKPDDRNGDAPSTGKEARVTALRAGVRSA